MSEIQQNRYDQLLRRVADLKGPGSKVNDALGELFPMIDVENVPAELLVLGGSRLAIGRVVLPANVGFFANAFLRNNTGSGVLGRVEQVAVWSSVAQNIVIGPTQNSSVASGNRGFLDGRVFGEGTALVTQGNNNFGVIGSDFFRVAVDGVNTTFWTPPSAAMVISEGTALSVSAGTNNTTIQVGFVWIERVAQPSELNL